MAMTCDQVRKLLAPEGAGLPLSDEAAEEVADHLDGCEECDRLLTRHLGNALARIPTAGSPSLAAARKLLGSDRRRFQLLKLTAAAAALLAILATGWSLTRPGRDSSPPRPADGSGRGPSLEERPPDPPKLADLGEVDQNLIKGDGVISLYLQFCLSCLNRPTEEDKREFLIRSLLILRETRSALRRRLEQREPAPVKLDVAVLEGLSTALQALRSSPLQSVKLLPSKIVGFAFLPDGQWKVDHLLGNTPFRLTLPTQPLYLNFGFLKFSLGADEALMGRIEDVFWTGIYVDLPRKMVDKDPGIREQALKDLLPLLSPRQKVIYTRVIGPP